jgi:hypothetical protein
LVRKKVEVVNYPDALADVAERERISINELCAQTEAAKPQRSASPPPFAYGFSATFAAHQDAPDRRRTSALIQNSSIEAFHN